jgi:hypothetical protein
MVLQNRILCLKSKGNQLQVAANSNFELHIRLLVHDSNKASIRQNDYSAATWMILKRIALLSNLLALRDPEMQSV